MTDSLYDQKFLDLIVSKLLLADQALRSCERFDEMSIRDQAVFVMSVGALKRISVSHAVSSLQIYRKKCLRRRNFFINIWEYVHDCTFQNENLLPAKDVDFDE